MGHLLSVVKFLWVQRKVRHYARAKEIALALHEKRKPKVGLIDYLLYWWAKYCQCGCITAYFRANLDNRLVIRFLLLYNRMTTAGTFSNYIAIAVLGFIGGVFFSLLYFSVISVIVDLSVPLSFWVSVFLCVFLTIGLAFIQAVRCVTLSILPEVCTHHARSMLVSFALIMMITGPGSNILYNSHQLTETITCTREQLHALSHNLTELYKKPLRALKNGIMNLIKIVQPAIDTVKAAINLVKSLVIKVGTWIKDAIAWLNKFAVMCKNAVGTPYDMCYRSVEKVMKDCEVKTLWLFRWVCYARPVLESVCLPLKGFGYFCNIVPYIHDTIIPSSEKYMKEIDRYVKSMFYVSVEFQHSFDFEVNQSKSTKQILKDVFHAEVERLSFFFRVLNFMKLALGLYILFIFLNAFMYRKKYFFSMHYDNYHINRYVHELDWKRASVHKQTLFPLTLSEKLYYVSLFSLRLTIDEQINFLRESLFLLLSAIKIAFLLIIDYSLHWIVSLITLHGNIQFHLGGDASRVIPQGSGLWYDIYWVMNGFLSHFGFEFNFNNAACLPQPIPPSYHIYEKAAYTLGFAWLMLAFQPFGLRFRNYIMSVYYPQIARKRAVYMYNYILQARGNISLYIRRNILRRSAFGLRADKPSIRKWLLTKYPKLRLILPYKDMRNECTLCGYLQPKIKCVTPDCPAYYCKDCFKMANRVCIWCNMPQDYSGSSVSEEEDSEEEIDLPDDQSKPLAKTGIIMSNVRHEMIELRDLEEARCSRSVPAKVVVIDTGVKDYFDESWRRDDWAHIDEFSITWPDLKLWIRSEYHDRIFD